MKTFSQFVADLSEGTKFVYHGTSSKTLDDIKKSGFINPSKAGTTRHWSGPHPSQNGVYVGTRPETAMTFAHMAAGNDKSEPVVLKLHRSALKGLKKDKEFTTKSAYYHPSPVSASAIAKVHNLGKKDETEDLLSHPGHQIALKHGFKPESDSNGKSEVFKTYTRPGTQHQGKDYLHLSTNRHTNNHRWEQGMKNGSDGESLDRHLKGLKKT